MVRALFLPQPVVPLYLLTDVTRFYTATAKSRDQTPGMSDEWRGILWCYRSATKDVSRPGRLSVA